jgi:hypothetical protein
MECTLCPRQYKGIYISTQLLLEQFTGFQKNLNV